MNYMFSLDCAKKVDHSKVEVYSFNKEDGIVGQMDCSGSNLVKLDEAMPGIIKLILSSRTNDPDCKAQEKADLFDVPLVGFDFKQYEEEEGVEISYVKALDIINNPKPHSDRQKAHIALMYRREASQILCTKMHDKMIEKGIKENIPHFGAGFMSILSDMFVNDHFILTVHPGDLTKYNVNRYSRLGRSVVGDGWVPSAAALVAGHENLYSSMFLTKPGMDTGQVFMRGYPLPIDYNRLNALINLKNPEDLIKAGKAAQETLKHIGDHAIAGATFMDLFDGKWGQSKGVLTYKYMDTWYEVPNGILIQDHINNTEQIIPEHTPFQRDEVFLEKKIEEFYDALR